jgi:hypothetical protein
VTWRPFLGNGSVNTFQQDEYAGNNQITSVAMQRVVNTTIEEEVFSMWLGYIHCGATDVFSVGPPRDYISGTEPNKIRIGSDRTRMRMGRVLGSQGRRVRLNIDCELL